LGIIISQKDRASLLVIAKSDEMKSNPHSPPTTQDKSKTAGRHDDEMEMESEWIIHPSTYIIINIPLGSGSGSGHPRPPSSSVRGAVSRARRLRPWQRQGQGQRHCASSGEGWRRRRGSWEDHWEGGAEEEDDGGRAGRIESILFIRLFLALLACFVNE